MRVTITNKLKHYIREYKWSNNMINLIGNSYDIDMNKPYKLLPGAWCDSYIKNNEPKLYTIEINHECWIIPRNCFETNAEKILKIL